MQFQRRIISGAVPAAGTTNYDIEASGLFDAIKLALYAKFVYGSGGTSIKLYVEGSYDQGTSWVPVGNVTFTTANDAKLFTVVPSSLGSTDADASQADDTVINHIPPRLRLRQVVAGTYAASTLDVWMVAN